MIKTINGAALRKMFLNAFSLVEENKKNIDALNVFPVPDGDTGTNMSLTLKSAVTEMNACESNTIESICVAFNRGALKGARGNSGVITSQIIKGICSVLMAKEEDINLKDFAKAIQTGSDMAYKAVTVPKEGTILTVIKAMAEKAKQASRSAKCFEDFFNDIIAHGEATLQMTPDMLPVLKKAGVVDAGGRGLVFIFSGFYKALTGEMTEVEFINNIEKDVTSEDMHVNYQSLADIKYAYCTEFFVINIYEKTTDADINALRSRLMEIGDCVLCIGDLQLIKVHVHTNDPGLAIQKALTFGQLSRMKIDNMREEHQEKLIRDAEKVAAQQAADDAKKEQEKKASEPRKAMGFITVSIGQGLNEIFNELGADYIIEGGQTMNPSTEDMLNAIDQVNADTIFILPNNKNIVLAANQAKALVKEKEIIVIPTKTVPQGITAIINFMPDADAAANEEAMLEAIQNVKTGQVTYAVRDTHVDDKEIHEGDIMGIGDKGILAVGTEVEETAKEMLALLVDEDSELISLYYGEEVSEEDAQKFTAEVEELYPDVDVDAHFGGQPIYYYVLAVE